MTLDIAKYMVDKSPDMKFYVFAYKIMEELCTEEVKRYITIIEVSRERHKRCEEITQHILNEGIGVLIQVVKYVLTSHVLLCQLLVKQEQHRSTIKDIATVATVCRL